MNREFELLQDKGDVASAMDILRNLLCGPKESVVYKFYFLFYLTSFFNNLLTEKWDSERKKRPDAPKVNESVRLTIGLTLLNC